MLVLTRKQNEKIRIGDDIVITVSKIAGGKVKIGVEAPKEVKVMRDELLARDEVEMFSFLECVIKSS